LTTPTASRPLPWPHLAKGGLDAVTRSLATEYASRGVRVNAVAPGVIKTPVHDPSSYEGMSGPLGRIGEISDIVDVILYLERACGVRKFDRAANRVPSIDRPAEDCRSPVAQAQQLTHP
jgi:NAD(P)-dependent dehydrogenase (short-subunit alcohol dehydrogenase family)